MRDRVPSRRKHDAAVELNVADVRVPDDATADIPEAPLEGESAAAAELRAGIDALKRATAHEREQASEQVHKSPVLDPDREMRIAGWMQQGLSEREANWLRSEPLMIDYPELSAVAAAEIARSGLSPENPEFFPAIKSRFHQHFDQMRRLNQNTPAATGEPPLDAISDSGPQVRATPVAAPPQVSTEGAVPEQPRPARAQPMPYTQQDPSAFVSAPVSRAVPGAAAFYDIPAASIRLTAEQRQIARASGISDVEYAKNLQRLEREKASGVRQR